VKTLTYDLAGNGRSQILKTAGFVKLVSVADGPVVGVHMVGDRIGELVAEAQLIYNWEAFPADVAQLIHPHPTQGEAIGEARVAVLVERVADPSGGEGFYQCSQRTTSSSVRRRCVIRLDDFAAFGSGFPFPIVTPATTDTSPGMCRSSLKRCISGTVTP